MTDPKQLIDKKSVSVDRDVCSLAVILGVVLGMFIGAVLSIAISGMIAA